MTDLQAILDRDPRSHTRSDRDAIIQMYRERRHTYNAAPQPKKAAAKVTKAEKEQLSLSAALKGSLDL